MSNQLRTFLQRELIQRQTTKPNYSLRAFARDLKVSPATISKLLKGQTSIHSNTIKRIIAKFPNLPSELLTESLSTAEMKSKILSEVDNSFQSAQLAFELRYHIPNTMCFRTLKRFKSKDSDKLIPHFIDTYLSDEHQVSSKTYFLKKPNGRYKSIITENFAKKLPNNWQYKNNNDLEVEFNSDGLPLIKQIFITLLGTDQMIYGHLKYRRDQAEIKGHLYDPKSRKKSKKIELLYQAFPQTD